MFQRVLAVTLAQVLRSIALVLLPISFLTLIAWSTAGSASGNTSDPMRASLWIWLAFHHLPFSLSLPPAGTPGYLSYLPLGALIFPILAIRSGFSRTLDRLDNDVSLITLARILFTIEYSVISMFLAYVSSSQGITPQWYFAPLIILPLVLLTTLSAGRRIVYSQALLFGSRAMAFLLGMSSIIFGISIFMHLSTVKNLTTVLAPGFLGGILLLLVNILYIPNAVVATLSYCAGAGFAIGSGTLVAPWTHRLAQIPAIPLLGAVPTEKSPWSMLSILVVIAIGVLLTTWTIQLSGRTLFQSYFLTSIVTLLLAALSSGALLTNTLDSVGVSLWKFPLVLIAEIGIGIALAIFLPRLSIRNPLKR
jgi:Family of unknown function (DUF6350)